jgi:DNA-binding YbaB/EbfC family protein
MSDTDFQKIMQQAQKMQSNIQKAQEEIVNLTVVGESGGGLVKVKMNGRHDVLRVGISPTLLTNPDRAMLEDLVAAAVNDAVRKIEKASREKMTGLMSGLNLPPEFMGGAGGVAGGDTTQQ